MSVDELFHDIRHFRQMAVELLQLLVIFQLPGIGRADADVRLDDDRITGFLDKFLRRRERCHGLLPCRRHLRLGILLLHQRLFLEIRDLVVLHAGRHVEIRAQTGIQLKPVLVHGFDPVDLAVFEGKKGNCTENLIIVLQ